MTLSSSIHHDQLRAKRAKEYKKHQKHSKSHLTPEEYESYNNFFESINYNSKVIFEGHGVVDVITTKTIFISDVSSVIKNQNGN